MSDDPIDITPHLIARRRRRLRLTPEEQHFDELVLELSGVSVDQLMSLLTAALDDETLALLTDELRELVIYIATKGGTA
jgi:DNA-binding MarR family transcriptional regulator